jgi:hypothetical protein
MTPRLASDALELLTTRLRADGKMAHFIASHLGAAARFEPAAARRLGRRAARRARGDLGLARLLPAARRQHRLVADAPRMTRFGLIACDDPFETGWDDTPRLDRRPILALDMNAYLLRQLRATARLAQRLGEDAIADRNAERADGSTPPSWRRLYDEERASSSTPTPTTGVRRPAVDARRRSCRCGRACRWSARTQRAMVRDVLLDPRRLFGAVPFPSVAYDESAYGAAAGGAARPGRRSPC